MRHPHCGDVNRLQYIMNTTLQDIVVVNASIPQILEVKIA